LLSFFASFFLKTGSAIFSLKPLLSLHFIDQNIFNDAVFPYLRFAGKKRKLALLRSNQPGIFPAIDASLLFDMIMF
jgi:hypothetical protein